MGCAMMAYAEGGWARTHLWKPAWSVPYGGILLQHFQLCAKHKHNLHLYIYISISISIYVYIYLSSYIHISNGAPNIKKHFNTTYNWLCTRDNQLSDVLYCFEMPLGLQFSTLNNDLLPWSLRYGYVAEPCTCSAETENTTDHLSLRVHKLRRSGTSNQ